jgi:cardiolipin synthase
VILPVTYTGKLTTAVLLAGFSSLIAGWPTIPGLRLVDSEWLRGFGAADVTLGIWLVYLGVVLSLAAAVQYTVIARKARDAAVARAQGEVA